MSDRDDACSEAVRDSRRARDGGSRRARLRRRIGRTSVIGLVVALGLSPIGTGLTANEAASVPMIASQEADPAAAPDAVEMGLGVLLLAGFIALRRHRWG